jgi:hypothetical protein
MVDRIIIIILTICSLESSLFAQENISSDADCLKRNSAIFAKALIECEGVYKVEELLKNDITLLTFWDVDSLGNILKLDKLISNKSFSNGFMDSVENYIIKNKKHFFICIEKISGNDEVDYYKIAKSDLFVDEKSHIINVAFPGELMIFYDYDRSNSKNCMLSKYKYLQEQIKKYLPN